MANRFDVVTQQLFQKNINDCSVEELQEIANEYPYFSPAQYAMLSKLNETDHSAYQNQLQKAILYYHDPVAFEQFINDENAVVEFLPLPEKVETNSDSQSQTDNNTVVEINDEFDHGSNNIEAPVWIDTKKNHEEEKAFSGEQAIVEEIQPIGKKDIEQEQPAEAPSVEEVDAIKDNESPEQLAFEPYHTVDYFASQGIKLSQEEAPKDKFGKQLKSFTEWLKTMKRLPVNEQVKPLDIQAEQNVETLAAHSVEPEEVFTEAMAEVWIRQGNREKAREIYNKLSLLNPSKRAYFAAKIESLK
jgi:hypothetical protein